MQTLFGVPATAFATTLLVLSGIILVAVGGFALRRPILAKMSLRNVPRRRLQSLLIVLGLMLSTVVITAALVTGDTMSYSVRTQATGVLGQIDHVISAPSASAEPTISQAQFESLRTATAAESNLDAFVPALLRPVGLLNSAGSAGDSRGSLFAPGAEYDSGLGGFKIAATGASAKVSDLAPAEIYLTQSAADRLEVKAGDTVKLVTTPGAAPVEKQVKGIVAAEGLPGLSGSVVVMNLNAAQTLYNMPGKLDQILVSAKDGTGEALTTALRGYMVKPEIAGEIATILRTTEVKTAIESAAKSVPDTQARFRTQVADLQSELGESGVSPKLRSLLADSDVSAWLSNLKTADAATLSQKFRQVSDFSVNDLKAKTVAQAEASGGLFISVFMSLGFFSILTGVLLIFLIFVMLAAERKSELGIARAIGLKRGSLVQMFSIEGLVYTLLASAVGVAVGAGVAYLMVSVISQVFNGTSGISSDYAFRVQFYAAPTSLLAAYCLGVLITFAVVAFSSWRVSRLNIITAIQNLPADQQPKKTGWLRRIWQFAQGLILLQFGASSIASGYQAEQRVAVTLGISLCIIGGALFVRWLLSLRFLRLNREIRDRVVFTLAGVGLLVFWGLPAIWNPALGLDKLKDGMENFVVSGVMLVLGAIWTLVYNADLLLKLFNRVFTRFGNLAPVLKTATAYPLHNRFRTGMTLAMFALVIFTIIVMMIVTDAADQVNAKQDVYSGGYNIQMQTSGTAVTADKLAQNAGVAGVGSVTFVPLEIRQTDGSKIGWTSSQIIGYDTAYLQQVQPHYNFLYRADGFANDAAIWQALNTRDDVIVVGQRNLGASSLSATDFTLEGQITPGRPLPGYKVEIRDPRTGTARAVTVIGVFRSSWVGDTMPGIQAGPALLGSFNNARTAPQMYFVKAAPGTDVPTLARDLNRQYLTAGAEFRDLTPVIASIRSSNLALNQLLQGFLALGLVVGIVAIGVISGRMVVERRQQIGILRAIGFQARTVQLSFLLEIGFIAVLGIGMGLALGLNLGWNYVADYSRDNPGVTFNPPWLAIGLLVAVASGAALLATWFPARRASRIYPSEALRYE
jgi:putative ABC transport system permease protein